MPLRDHFHPPLSKTRSWDEVHGGWPAFLVQLLNRKLPPRYTASPQVYLGRFAEIDVTAFKREHDPDAGLLSGNGNGAVATAIWAPPAPTLAITTDFPAQDVYEVRIYDEEQARRLVAAIELVSPSNKDRPQSQRTFASKCAALLQNQVSVTIVDTVTNRKANLYGELLELIGHTDPLLGDNPPAIYAVACRTTQPGGLQGDPWELQSWLRPLQIGHSLPTLPLWLADDLAIPLNLEEGYEEACRSVRIA